MWPVTDSNNNDASDSSDDDVLQAVLEFVETFDGEHTTTHTTADQVRDVRTRKRHSSERTKAEIRALRELTVQLEDRVAHLQYEQAARRAMARNAPVPGCWELEAMRQEEQRLQAEMENLELKRIIETQAKVAERLEVLFHRRMQSHDNAFDAVGDNQEFHFQMDDYEDKTNNHGSD